MMIVDNSQTSIPANEPSAVSEVAQRLPFGGSDMVGRSRELAQISRLVKPTTVVTLTGPAGIGKTRLAVEVAVRLEENYPDGAWFIDLAPVRDPELVPQVAASALGFDAEPGRAPLDAFCARLRGRRALLVLDNCEHLRDACAKLAERVSVDCIEVSLLTTSQQALGIAIEETVTIGPLTLPEPNSSPAVGSVADVEAVLLFCARARAARSAFRLTDDIVPAIVTICRRLDGIPLAIELAAARIAVLGPAEIAERIDQRFRLLADGTAEGSRRQTLRAALDWSHDLLTAEEATLFRRLAVFAGGTGLSAVEEVCSGKGVDP
jgi:non-specific serine/threonine protein kinase